jgi:hypothetical protein
VRRRRVREVQVRHFVGCGRFEPGGFVSFVPESGKECLCRRLEILSWQSECRSSRPRQTLQTWARQARASHPSDRDLFDLPRGRDKDVETWQSTENE